MKQEISILSKLAGSSEKARALFAKILTQGIFMLYLLREFHNEELQELLDIEAVNIQKLADGREVVCIG